MSLVLRDFSKAAMGFSVGFIVPVALMVWAWKVFFKPYLEGSS